MPTHEIDVSSKPAKANYFGRLAWGAFSFAYGTFSLGAFALLAAIRKPNFRRLDDKSRKEVTNGMQPSC